MTDTAHRVADGSRSLYEHDFFAWTVEQAATLRSAARAGADPALDWETLAEEVASMGRSERDALTMALVRIIEHLIKLEYSPAVPPRRGWRQSSRLHRLHAWNRLEGSPSLRSHVDLRRVYGKARKLFAPALAETDDLDAETFPEACPYTLDQILDDEWWPANRCGLTP